MNHPVVLFLCTGNSACSQMAEAFLKKYGGDRLEVAAVWKLLCEVIHDVACRDAATAAC